ncbi:MAG TPA: (2Fe-2S)-binding protein [candidate division Zixibacteria bacterium]|nr:(2Fe-2S)-binding protein [candidate division Zixibacteria bacterium]
MSRAQDVSITINGRVYDLLVPPNETLLELLRYRLQLTGTKSGCETGHCGACTVLVDGNAVNSCLVLGIECDGRSVTTIEGIAADDELHPLQQSFIDNGVVQCGFCTPGMIMAAKSLLDEDPDPAVDTIRSAIAGNLCRCAGYLSAIRAVGAAAEVLRRKHKR